MCCISRTSTAVPGTEDQKYIIWMNKSACLLRLLTSELEITCTYILAPSRVRVANSYRPSQLQHFVSTWWDLFWCQDEVHILAASFPISWAPVTYTSLCVLFSADLCLHIVSIAWIPSFPTSITWIASSCQLLLSPLEFKFPVRELFPVYFHCNYSFLL